MAGDVSDLSAEMLFVEAKRFFAGATIVDIDVESHVTVSVS
jgi:hypothetical protein